MEFIETGVIGVRTQTHM